MTIRQRDTLVAAAQMIVEIEGPESNPEAVAAAKVAIAEAGRELGVDPARTAALQIFQLMAQYVEEVVASQRN